MFSKFINYIKEAILKMFDRNTYKKYIKKEIAVSSKMIENINLWNKMLKGEAPWLDDTVKSQGIEKAICKEFSNVVLSEMETEIANNEELDEIYQQAIRNLNENFQQGLGLGSFIVKPLGVKGDVEFVIGDNVIPLEFDSNGRLKKVVFMQSLPVGSEDVFYRFEFHELEDGQGLTIKNKAFKGTKGDIGSEIPLSAVKQWKDLPNEVHYPTMDRVDFGYYRNPIPNLIDRSFNGVSVFSDAINQIKKVDIQASRLDWEFESGERMVFADYTTLDKKNDRFTMPSGKDRLMIGVDMDGKLDTFNPALREMNYINGLEQYLRQVEFNVGLAYGDLSRNDAVEKTATEIKASKMRKYNMVNSMQRNLKDCLEDLAYALAFYNSQYTSKFDFECNFHDSIMTDEETERAQDRIDMSNGIMSRLEYRKKWYNEDDETALKNLPQIEQEAIE